MRSCRMHTSTIAVDADATPVCEQACQQRSSVRAALIGTQTELAEAAAELEAWTHELAAFQDIVDAVSYSALLSLCAFWVALGASWDHAGR